MASSPSTSRSPRTAATDSANTANATISSRALAAQHTLLKAIKSTKPADIEAAVAKWDFLANHIPDQHPDYEAVHASYAVALILRWEDSHQVKDIRKAIISLESALASMPAVPSKNRYQNLANLGAAYMDRYETYQKEPKDILRAIECWEQAHITAVPLGLTRDSASKILTNLAEAYFYAFEVGVAGVEAVKNAIKYFELVTQHGREEKRGSTRYKIGQCYSALYLRSKDTNDLHTAIDSLQAATEVELDREERQGALTELSRTYSRKYEVTRHKSDLEAAIRWGRLAVQENQGEPWILRNLANLLYWTFKDWKDPKVLDEAIEYYEVIWALYQTKPARSVATFYHAYATALIRRYDLGVRGNLQDIERAVDLLQLAVGGARQEDKADYEHRLKGAIVRRDRAKRHSFTSPPPTMRSSNTLAFPSPPNSPSATTFVEPADLSKRGSGAPRRAPIPSLAVRPDTATMAAASSTTLGTSSTTYENSTPMAIPGSTTTLSRTPSTRSKRMSTASQSTIMPMPMAPSNSLSAAPRKGQTAPSLLSESMSVMTVPAVQDLPNAQFQQARPRVLRRQTRTLPDVPLVKPPPATKMAPLGPADKPRFLSFARIRGSKSP